MIPSPSAPSAGMAAPATNLADLKRKSVRGGMITFASQGASVAIQLTSTVILARLLSPDDYGVMAMVVAITSFAGLFRDLGLSSAAIQKATLTHAQQSNLFWINVALGCTLTVLLAAASPLVAWFYGKPEVLWVTAALSASFLIGSLSSQSGALLVREMRFGRQAVAGICGALVTLITAVTLALHGFRYWSLVWSQLAGALTMTTLLFMLSPFRPGLPGRGTGLRAMLMFGANITAFDFVNYFHRNLDNILIGRLWGTGALGLYSRAYALLMFPISNLRGPVNAVAFPAMSRLQDEPAAYRAYYRRIIAVLALISMPFSALLFVSAHPVIEIALGRQWLDIVPIFSVLAAVSFVQPVITLWGVVSLSTGQTRRYLHLGIMNTAFSAAGFLIGLPWAGLGVAAGYAAATYLSAYPLLAWAFRGTPVGIGDFLSGISRPMTASITGAVLDLLLFPRFFEHTTPWAEVVLHTLLFVPAYFACFICLPGGRTELSRARNLLPRPIRSF
ncbi:MAG: lipopolysaccharide biosynthesis protein [Verrucomicrobiota bacterium]